MSHRHPVAPIALAVAFSAALLFASSAVSAAILTWTLQNVSFSDGGTASGSFDYDADTNTYSDFSISVSGGGALFPSFVYDNGTSHTRPPLTATDLSISSNVVIPNDTRELFLQFAQPLTNAGGSIVLENPDGLANDAEFHTLPSSPPFGQRGFVAGGSVTAVPEPSTAIGLMLAAAFALVIWMKQQSPLRRARIRN